MAQTHPALHIGTMGWTYRDWLGVFYPQDASRKDYLAYYARVFDALEIDSTFYFIPGQAVVSSWYAKTPPDFRFTAKFPREITHEKGLTGVDEALAAFLKSMAVLGHKLGALLIQLPPSFRNGDVEFDRMTRFLAGLPSSEFRFAVEFRHPSWITPAVFDLLRERRIAWTIQDHPWYMPFCPEVTADFTYIRWMGENDDPRVPNGRRVVLDRSQELIKWAARIKRDILPDVHVLFGFFNNPYAGHAPASCNQMKRLLGLDTVLPETSRQMRLF